MTLNSAQTKVILYLIRNDFGDKNRYVSEIRKHWSVNHFSSFYQFYIITNEDFLYQDLGRLSTFGASKK